MVSYDEKEYPTIHNYSFGIPAAELGVGEYKYDSEAYSMSDLQHINDSSFASYESNVRMRPERQTELAKLE